MVLTALAETNPSRRRPFDLDVNVCLAPCCGRLGDIDAIASTIGAARTQFGELSNSAGRCMFAKISIKSESAHNILEAGKHVPNAKIMPRDANIIMP